MMQVSIRELKSKLSHYLRLVQAGESMVITKRGKPIARILPISTIEQKIDEFLRAGLVLWNKKKFSPTPPVAKVRGSRTVSDLPIEDRL